MRHVACIDIGTITARLAVADVSGGHVTRMAKSSQIVNLGQDVDATGRLREDAIARVLDLARAYVESARAAGAEAACCTLTSAARDAANSGELLDGLRRLGLEPEVIPGEVEGSLTFLGVAQDFEGRRILVADNGGGSTELACGRLCNGTLELGFVRSVNVGARRVTERFLAGDGPASAESLAAAHEFVARELGRAVADGGLALDGAPEAPEALVCCGGTVTSLVAIDKRLDPYDPAQVHLAALSAERIRELEALLAERSVDERAGLAGLQAKRAPVILGGAVILSELVAQTGAPGLQASESDLLFGLAITAAASMDGAPTAVSWRPQMRPVG